MALLDVEDLRLTYRRRRFGRVVNEVRAVDGISFSLDRGSTLAIVGESGAGKSTVARLVLRLVQTDGGSVRFEGRDLLEMSARELQLCRRRMQMIFQDPIGSFDPTYSIAWSMAEPLKVHFGMNRVDRETRVTELIDRVGLSRDLLHRKPRQLSGGQLQRVAIARALTLDPALLVCDEAVSALDVSVRAQVLNLLLDIQDERSVACLFIAHDLGVVESFADDVLVMRQGKVVEHGQTDTVFRSPQNAYTRELLASIPRLDRDALARRSFVRRPIHDRSDVLGAGHASE